MFNGFYFEFPFVAFALLLFIVCAKFCKMKVPSIYFPHTQQFASQAVSASKILFLLKWLGITMLIVALMSPVKDAPYEVEPKDGYEIALILDASGSMKARGFDSSNVNLTRFDVVKSMASDFISQRKK